MWSGNETCWPVQANQTDVYVSGPLLAAYKQCIVGPPELLNPPSWLNYSFGPVVSIDSSSDDSSSDGGGGSTGTVSLNSISGKNCRSVQPLVSAILAPNSAMSSLSVISILVKKRHTIVISFVASKKDIGAQSEPVYLLPCRSNASVAISSLLLPAVCPFCPINSSQS